MRNFFQKRWVLFWVLLFGGVLSVVLFPRKKNPEVPPSPTMAVAQTKNQSVVFYFKGTLLPIRTISVLSPVDGVVQQVYFNYGAHVRKGEPLVSIQSTKLVETFRTAVGNFLQKKAAMEGQQTKYAGDQELYQAGVISRQDFISSKDSYGTSVLDFNQAKVELEKILEPLQVSEKEVEPLHLSDTQSVSKLLQRRFSDITVTAPADGVVLIPIKTVTDTAATSSESNGQLKAGSVVKDQQPILSMGDLSGYEVDVQVSELDVTRLKPGLKAVVSGDAFPGVQLPAMVQQVAVQADPNQNQGQSSVSLFNVVVHVPNVPAAVSERIRVGMTAKVAIELTSSAHVVLPTSAVFMRAGQPRVTIVDPKTKQQREVVVETGLTSTTEITIMKGVKVGDSVLLYEASDA